MTDEIIRGVWRAKDAIAADHQYDPKRLVDHLRKRERATSCKVVDLHARPRAESAGA